MILSPSITLVESALRSLAEGLAIIDHNRHLAYLNPRAEELFDLSANECRRCRADDFYLRLSERGLDPAALRQEFENAAAGAEQLPRLEFGLIKPRRRIIEAQWFPMRDDTARSLGYGILFRDVTREKELDEMKNQLLSTVSHELRTPLAAIKGFTTTLLRDDVRWDDATQRDFLNIIEEETDRLGELIDNLLDMSQIEAGALRVEKEPVQLRNLVREAVERVQTGLQTESHWFVQDLPAALPHVWADPRRIRQVLNNLLTNAIKYSPNGGQITIRCEVVRQLDNAISGSPPSESLSSQQDRVDARTEGDQVTVSVSDQGVGIPPAQLDQVFERFFQMDGATTRKTGGSGLGLSISKGIIEAHGGTIWAESNDGQGSTFYFTLPLVNEELTRD